jgi:hypothetical protein
MLSDSLKHHEEVERKATREKRCSDCGKKIKPIFKPTKDPLDWMFLSCDTCSEEFCSSCCETDSNGKCQCFTCYEASLYQKA